MRLVVEQMRADFKLAHGLRAVQLRFSTPPGRSWMARLGSATIPKLTILLSLEGALGNGSRFTLCGDD